MKARLDSRLQRIGARIVRHPILVACALLVMAAVVGALGVVTLDTRSDVGDLTPRVTRIETTIRGDGACTENPAGPACQRGLRTALRSLDHRTVCALADLLAIPCPEVRRRLDQGGENDVPPTAPVPLRPTGPDRPDAALPDDPGRGDSGGGDVPQPAPEPVEPPAPPSPHAKPSSPPAPVIDRLCSTVRDATKLGLPLVCR